MGVEVRHVWGMTETGVGTLGVPKVSIYDNLAFHNHDFYAMTAEHPALQWYLCAAHTMSHFVSTWCARGFCM